MKSESEKELLKIEDYYFDELIELTEQQFNSATKNGVIKSLVNLFRLRI